MPEATLLELLDLETIEHNLYRANLVLPADDEWPLYGGQVAAQALRAAGLTVDAGRLPHSLHGYFLRKGDSTTPMVFKVYRDRDGRSFSARRVVAVQRGAVIFNMSASFQLPIDGAVTGRDPAPDTPAPDELASSRFGRLLSVEARFPPQPLPESLWPTRYWSRVSVPLPADPLVHACALTYVSDVSTGVLPDGDVRPGSSLDHAVWFHRPADLNAWTLSDYRPQASGQGRGWYTGSVFDEAGTLVASIAQECLFR